ncbi:MAG: 3-deoxy-manno-octulosonate cytidylyltransferase [Rhodospirillaceae bacterium]|jgi:3-deoxy-manno-octulosonate cytidylyltransferase (CMP-KDO synthetase)|nr:3-deoxy-manno-octulosonate cytidylyltransferase [Rhodospirillaceae bacterium]
MDIVIIIPARFNSRRFPGKPLTLITGISLLERVFNIAKTVNGISDIYITTDDQRIIQHASSFGANAILTSTNCATGTDRIHETLKFIKKRPDVVINLQGDAVLTPPGIVQCLVDEIHTKTKMVTAAVQCTWSQICQIKLLKKQSPTSGTFVTINKSGHALYFSKAIIPYTRSFLCDDSMSPIYRHIGIYGYSCDTLDKLSNLDQSPLESVEQLEQLRALENDIPIKVVVVDYCGRTHGSVDSPEDVPFIESIIAREGELVK